MSKYFQYYKALKFRKDPSEKTLYGFMLAVFIAVLINNLGFSGWDGLSVIGPSFILLIVIFAVGFSQAEVLNEPDILLQLNFTAKERVKYYYIHILVVFFIVYLIFIGLLYIFIGLMWVLSFTYETIDLSSDSNDFIHYAGDLYSLAFSFIQVAIYALMGFIKSIKKRYIYFILATLSIILLHALILSIYNGELGIYSVYEVLSPTGASLYFSTTLIFISFLLVYGSYRLTLNKHMYH